MDIMTSIRKSMTSFSFGTNQFLMWRHHTEAARFVGLGVKPGVADLILLHDAKFHALELKAHAKSRVSKAQKQFIADVKNAGGVADIGYGLGDAIRCMQRGSMLAIVDVRRTTEFST
jgi:hypothetical protein